MVAALGRAFPFVIAAAIALLLVAGGVRRWRRAAVIRQFRQHYGPMGKDLLIVLTESPHWHPYIETQWLPRWGTRAVVFNRSRPWDPRQPEAKLWNAVKGIEEHTPLAVVVPPDGKVRVVRFFHAFRDFKHGKERRLRAAERELRTALEGSSRRDA